jgi:hypothetical protein
MADPRMASFSMMRCSFCRKRQQIRKRFLPRALTGRMRPVLDRSRDEIQSNLEIQTPIAWPTISRSESPHLPAGARRVFCLFRPSHPGSQAARQQGNQARGRIPKAA